MRNIILFIHLVAAVVWVGGILFLAMIVPFLRRLNLPNSAPMLRALGIRFRDISWVAVGVLVVTGIGNLYFLYAFDDLLRFLGAHSILIWKLVSVAAMIAIKALHDFFVGPRAAQIPPDVGFKSRWWQAARFLGNANVVLGLIVLYLAMLLVAG
ncbi:MAG: CopD family protein [Chloroflexi bacterium]|nr:CopD family protein [Chloroflexota bacterium]